MVDEENRVGFGKPPKEHRFKPGQSGNPKGRPRTAPRGSDYADIVLRELEEPLTLRVNGQARTITTFEAILKRLTQKALSGDPRAMRQAIDQMKEAQAITAALREELFVNALKYQLGWQAAMRRGEVTNFDHLFVSPEELVLDHVKGEVRRVLHVVEGGKLEEICPEPGTLVRLLKSFPPPAIDNEPDDAPIDQLISEARALAGLTNENEELVDED